MTIQTEEVNLFDNLQNKLLPIIIKQGRKFLKIARGVKRGVEFNKERQNDKKKPLK